MGNNAVECEAKPLIPAFSPLGRGEGDEARAFVYLIIHPYAPH